MADMYGALPHIVPPHVRVYSEPRHRLQGTHIKVINGKHHPGLLPTLLNLASDKSAKTRGFPGANG